MFVALDLIVRTTTHSITEEDQVVNKNRNGIALGMRPDHPDDFTCQTMIGLSCDRGPTGRGRLNFGCPFCGPLEGSLFVFQIAHRELLYATVSETEGTTKIRGCGRTSIFSICLR